MSKKDLDFHKEERLTINQVAEKLGIHERTVLRYIHNKELRATRIGRWYVRPEDLEEFIRSRTNIPEDREE